MITTDHPLRHPLQIIVSSGQVYGDILYYATSMFDHYLLGVTYSRPEAYYFWGYYFLMNFFWIVIPGREYLTSKLHRGETVANDVTELIYNSVVACAEAFKTSARVSATKKTR